MNKEKQKAFDIKNILKKCYMESVLLCVFEVRTNKWKKETRSNRDVVLEKGLAHSLDSQKNKWGGSGRNSRAVQTSKNRRKKIIKFPWTNLGNSWKTQGKKIERKAERKVLGLTKWHRKRSASELIRYIKGHMRQKSLIAVSFRDGTWWMKSFLFLFFCCCFVLSWFLFLSLTL